MVEVVYSTVPVPGVQVPKVVIVIDWVVQVPPLVMITLPVPVPAPKVVAPETVTLELALKDSVPLLGVAAPKVILAAVPAATSTVKVAPEVTVTVSAEVGLPPPVPQARALQLVLVVIVQALA